MSFMRKTINAYHNQKKRASKYGSEFTITAEDIREIVKAAEGYTCPYCDRTITETDWELDHIWPISRGGTFSKANTHATCRSCNIIKGDMTHEEYKKFSTLINSFPRQVANSIKGRLKAGGKAIAKGML